METKSILWESQNKTKCRRQTMERDKKGRYATVWRRRMVDKTHLDYSRNRKQETGNKKTNFRRSVVYPN